MTTTARTPGAAAQIGALAGFAIAVTAAAALGALGVGRTAGEYASLDTPSWAPPSDVFAPVWTVLYALMAVSGWLVWRKVGWGTEVAVFAGQLVLNAAWTPLFFGAGNYGLALVDIVVLWLAIGATIALFHRVSRPAAWLLVPYWAWVTFATALNWSIWRMNP